MSADQIPLQVDCLVQGFIGFRDVHATGRVYYISPFGWVAFYDAEKGRQHVSYAGRFLVRDVPRPPHKRADIPERLRR